MSFSFAAGGTKAQTLDSLAKVTRDRNANAQPIADLLIDMVGAGPDEITGADEKPYETVYTVSASGHQSSGLDLPSLHVTLGCSYRPKETRGGIEVDPDPADIR